MNHPTYAITDQGFIESPSSVSGEHASRPAPPSYAGAAGIDLNGLNALDLRAALDSIVQEVFTIRFDAESSLVGNPLVARLCGQVQKLASIVWLQVGEK